MFINCTLNLSSWVVCTCFQFLCRALLFMYMHLRENHGKWVELYEADSTLTVHFIRSSRSYLINQISGITSCRDWSWAAVHIRHQNGEKNLNFVSLTIVWLLVTEGLVCYFRNCQPIIFTHNISRVYIKWYEKYLVKEGSEGWSTLLMGEIREDLNRFHSC